MSETPQDRSIARLAATPFAAVYPLYLNKVLRKGRTRQELDAAIGWLTGFHAEAIAFHLDAETSFQAFFDAATLPTAAMEVSGTVCGVRVEEVAHPLMRRIRILDKLVDELAKGRPLATVLREGTV